MRRGWLPALVWSAALLGAGGAASTVLQQPSNAAWRPAVTLWGGGDPERAVAELGRVTGAADVVLHRSHVDAATRTTWRDALAQLDDFDLRGLHRLLPAAPDGAHELRVRGELEADGYQLRRGDVTEDVAVCVGGSRHALLDLECALRVEPIASDVDGARRYLVDGQLGVGVGDVHPRDVVDAAIESARILERVAEPPALPAAVGQVRALHPMLQDEDVEVLAVVFAAYPRTGDVLGRVVELEDLRSAATHDGVRDVQLRVRVNPARLARHYPVFARYLERIGPLLSVQAEWTDRAGRTLGKATLDSSTLTATSECRIRDGVIVPFGSIEPGGLAHTGLSLDARLELYGLGLRMRGLPFDVAYEAEPELVRVRAAMTRAPSAIDVDGAALGFVPPDVVDALIPGNMRGLARDFLRVATTGNDGEGLALAVALGRDPASGDAVLDARGALEALDNRLVALGVGMVNERLLPSDAALDDVIAFLSDLHGAFVLDLNRFTARVAEATAPPPVDERP